MRATDIILKKRGTFVRAEDGGRRTAGDTALTRDEIRFIVDGYTDGSVPEYQIAAWLMAVYFNGMTFEETGWLTECMLRSGDVIDLHGRESEGLCGPFVDKHSTGGVGDKISLPLAPIAAACGVQVPMMSGRALGHTGGTLDKLESIEGYDVRLPPEKFARLIARTGYAMTGQTEKIVPADRLLYALRDVTGTVESVPLITASIMSKKAAEGADAFVFDVKYGSGAFMKSVSDAELLASFLVRTAAAMGKKASALITNMDTPLGRNVGNFLEVEEALDCLNGKGPDDVMEETYALGARMLLLGGRARSEAEAEAMCRKAVASGAALDKFMANVRDQGGNPDRLLKEAGKRRSPYRTELRARQSGYVTLDAYRTGLACVTLGVGRSRTTDPVCPDAGLVLHAKTGTRVTRGDVIMEIYGKDGDCLAPAAAELSRAVTYSEEKAETPPLIYKTIYQ